MVENLFLDFDGGEGRKRPRKEKGSISDEAATLSTSEPNIYTKKIIF
jgi:hypothetical protein